MMTIQTGIFDTKTRVCAVQGLIYTSEIMLTLDENCVII